MFYVQKQLMIVNIFCTRPVGLEPTTSGFGDLRSTTELRAHIY